MNPARAQRPQHPRLPSLARRFLTYLLGFSISVAIGLAPYLGTWHVPGFSPMLSLIPNSLRDIALPLSSATMGIVTVWVQLQGSARLRIAQLQSWFRRALVIWISALFIFVALEMLAVTRIEVPAVNQTVTFVTGLVHPHTAPCEMLGRAECIKTRLSLDEGRIDSYFGEIQINFTKLALLFSYLVLMSFFGVLVGAVTVRGKSNSSAG